MGALTPMAYMVLIGFASDRGPGPSHGYWVPTRLKGVPHCEDGGLLQQS